MNKSGAEDPVASLMEKLKLLATMIGGTIQEDGSLVGIDTTGASARDRECFLSGRIHSALDMQIGADYESVQPKITDEDSSDFVLTNRRTKRRYRVTVEEISE